MRLRTSQTRLIEDCLHQKFSTVAETMLFGLRLDETAHGRDVDLLVETAAHPSVRRRALVTMTIEQAWNLPVNILAHQRCTPANVSERVVRAKAKQVDPPIAGDGSVARRPRQPAAELARTISCDDLIGPAVAAAEWDALTGHVRNAPWSGLNAKR